MPTFEEIRILAYKIWEEEGRPEGKAVEHYLKAKEILDKQEAERIPQLSAPKPLGELPPAPVYAELEPPRERAPSRRKRATGNIREKHGRKRKQ